jgi:hypothetical protein
MGYKNSMYLKSLCRVMRKFNLIHHWNIYYHKCKFAMVSATRLHINSICWVSHNPTVCVMIIIPYGKDKLFKLYYFLNPAKGKIYYYFYEWASLLLYLECLRVFITFCSEHNNSVQRECIHMRKMREVEVLKAFHNRNGQVWVYLPQTRQV